MGDEIMLTWLVRERRKQDPRPVCLLDRNGRARAHPLWAGNPGITTDLDGAQVLVEGPGVRHYIERKTSTRWTWIRHPDREPGDIFLPPAPRKVAEPYIYIEPNSKPQASPNKDWGFRNYQAVVDALGGETFIQCGPGRQLRRVRTFPLTSLVDALQYLRHARLYVGPEGGMHHAAAALGVPAVVIFGGFIAPDVTGYRSHINLFAGGEACGMRIACAHCARAMAAITVDRVVDSILTLMES